MSKIRNIPLFNHKVAKGHTKAKIYAGGLYFVRLRAFLIRLCGFRLYYLVSLHRSCLRDHESC